MKKLLSPEKQFMLRLFIFPCFMLNLVFGSAGFFTNNALFAQNTVVFTYNGNLQSWQVPCGVNTITLNVYGAAGGSGYNSATGGGGAYIEATCTVTPEHTLSIAVGGPGTGSSVAGGGGGGSFVWDSNTVTLLVAAGGGGGASYGGDNGADGGTDLTFNAATTGTGGSGNTVGGTAGNGGDTGLGFDAGFGGAGWLSNGVVGTQGGQDRANGFGGGISGGENGGYGGGGAGSGGGGGGGGFNGGGGGYGNVYGSGGGGGSYLNGTLISALTGYYTNGYVSILYYSPEFYTPYSQANSVQNFQVPDGVTTVTITIAGGAGGSGYHSTPGGNGASFSGVCTVTSLDNLSIVVGAAGASSSDEGGGGGGSFVWNSSGALLIAAAGGGGSGYSTNAGADAGIDLTFNATTLGNGGGGNTIGGTAGNGGDTGSGFDGGGGGAGWYSNGVSGTYGGQDQANGFSGGIGNTNGGYGGGGGASGGGGGGGGFNGGGGGFSLANYGGGGGGGSYLAGTVSGTPAASNTGDGSVAIYFVPLPLTLTATAVPATSGCNGSATATPAGGLMAYTYYWTPGGQTTATISRQCSGNYCCQVTDAVGCVRNVCVSVVTGIENINNSSLINVYPNPGAGYFTITGLIEGQTIDLYNYTGQKMSSFVADNPVMHLDLSNNANGVYLVRIVNRDGSFAGQSKIVNMQ